MNKVFLIGRLSRDPELRHTTSGMAVCQINVAISRRTAAGRDPETDFINVVVWDKQAENISRYLSKGRQVAIVHKLWHIQLLCPVLNSGSANRNH